jgi:hypothetical protein
VESPREAIRAAFDAYFVPGYRLSLPAECLGRDAGGYQENGWDVQYRFGEDFLEMFATHRMTNDRLYRVYADGRVEMVGSSTDGMVTDLDAEFYAEVRRRGYRR